MAFASVSGLASGLDTATIINQLMQLEAIPQNRLRAKAAVQEGSVISLQGLNSKFASLTTKAEELADPSAWAPLTASSSNEDVTVKAESGASAGTYEVTVKQRARAHQLTFTATAALDARVTPTGSTKVSLDLQDGEGPVLLETGDATLQGLVDALNGADTGVRATTIKLDDGTYRLRVQSAETGLESDFTLKNEDGTDLLGGATEVLGQDAQVIIGVDTLSSASNTFADIIDGVDFTIGAEVELNKSFDITVSRDSAGMADDVKSLVDSINAALSQIDNLTSYDSTTKEAGPFVGDTLLRSLRANLVTSIYPSDGGSMADLGIELDGEGRLVFDAEAFKAAYETDPAAIAAQFTEGDTAGFAARIATVADTASDSVDGTLTLAIKGRENTIDRLEDSIADWDVRLEMRRQTMTRQFTAMETALSQMQSQGQWLAGQIASLPQIKTD